MIVPARNFSRLISQYRGTSPNHLTPEGLYSIYDICFVLVTGRNLKE